MDTLYSCRNRLPQRYVRKRLARETERQTPVDSRSREAAIVFANCSCKLKPRLPTRGFPTVPLSSSCPWLFAACWFWYRPRYTDYVHVIGSQLHRFEPSVYLLSSHVCCSVMYAARHQVRTIVFSLVCSTAWLAGRETFQPEATPGLAGPGEAQQRLLLICMIDYAKIKLARRSLEWLQDMSHQTWLEDMSHQTHSIAGNTTTNNPARNILNTSISFVRLKVHEARQWLWQWTTTGARLIHKHTRHKPKIVPCRPRALNPSMKSKTDILDIAWSHLQLHPHLPYVIELLVLFVRCDVHL